MGGGCKVCGEYSGRFRVDVRDGLWVWGVGVCVGSVGFVVNIQEGFGGGGGVRDGLWVWGVRVCGGSV